MSRTRSRQSEDALPTGPIPVDLPDQLALQVIPAAPILPPSLLDHYGALPQSESAGIMTTLDLKAPGNLIRVQHALAGGSTSLWDISGARQIHIVDLVAHYTESILEETGELRAGPMLTMIGPDGVFHTASEFAFRALQCICKLRDIRPPFDPPLLIMPVRLKSRGKREYQSILLVE